MWAVFRMIRVSFYKTCKESDGVFPHPTFVRFQLPSLLVVEFIYISDPTIRFIGDGLTDLVAHRDPGSFVNPKGLFVLEHQGFHFDLTLRLNQTLLWFGLKRCWVDGIGNSWNGGRLYNRLRFLCWANRSGTEGGRAEQAEHGCQKMVPKTHLSILREAALWKGPGILILVVGPMPSVCHQMAYLIRVLS